MEASLEVRPLSVPELFARAGRTLASAPVVILGSALCGVALDETVALWLVVDETSEVSSWAAIGLWMLVSGGVHALAGAAISLAVADLHTAGRAGLAAVRREIAAHGVSIFATGAVASMLVWIGYVLLIVPGVLAALRWIYFVPVMSVERRYGRPALRRSSELSRSASGRAFLLYLTSLAVWSVVLLELLWPDSFPWALRVSLATAIDAFLWTLIAVAYLGVRARCEAFDAEVLEEQRGG